MDQNEQDTVEELKCLDIGYLDGESPDEYGLELGTTYYDRDYDISLARYKVKAEVDVTNMLLTLWYIDPRGNTHPCVTHIDLKKR